MTKDKARKRVVRARMAKTGERYSAARVSVTGPGAPHPDPGVSDEAIRRGSGRSWAQWFRILDAWGASERKHAEIARHLREDLGVPGWWAQSVTVGYERARGMRQRHQGPEGFNVGVSKTMPVDVDRLYAAFVQPRKRNRWLETGTVRMRTAQEGKSARFDFRDDGSRVLAAFIAKGPAKATVALQHERLPDADAVERVRGFWKERLSKLANSFGG
jgi:hypothetical protein